MATTWYGGTAGDVIVDDQNRGYSGLTLDLFSDAAFTTPATGLVNEAGATVGGSVTAGPGGRIRFGDPAGGTTTYFSPARYVSVAGVVQPDSTGGAFRWRPEIAPSTAPGIAYDTDGVPYLTS